MGDCFFIENGVCKLGLFQGKPKASDCDECEHYSGEARGLGDRVHKVMKTTGVASIVKRVKPQGCGCGKRRAALNRMYPTKGSD